MINLKQLRRILNNKKFTPRMLFYLYAMQEVEFVLSLKKYWWGAIILSTGVIYDLVSQPEGGIPIGRHWSEVVASLLMLAWVFIYASHVLSTKPYDLAPQGVIDRGTDESGNTVIETIPDDRRGEFKVTSHRNLISIAILLVISLIFVSFVPIETFVLLVALMVVTWFIPGSARWSEFVDGDLPKLGNIALLVATTAYFLFTS